MGLALCRKHGETGVIPSISLDICEEISASSSNLKEITEILIVTIKVFDGDEHLFDQENYISKKLFDDLNMHFYYEIHNEDDEDVINSFFPKTSGMCAKCFKEYSLKNKINLIHPKAK